MKYSREMFGFPGIFIILALSFEGGFSSPPRNQILFINYRRRGRNRRLLARGAAVWFGTGRGEKRQSYEV